VLLDKLEFIAPENNSGFIPKEGSVKVIKNDRFSYINLDKAIGDAPKCMMALYYYEREENKRKANPQSLRKYSAKSANKLYPNESIKYRSVRFRDEYANLINATRLVLGNGYVYNVTPVPYRSYNRRRLRAIYIDMYQYFFYA
jgi:hypothetical protein